MAEKKKEIKFRKSVDIIDGVDVKIDGKKVVVKGSKGELTREFSDARFNLLLDITKEGSTIVVESKDTKRKTKAFVGTVASHIRNMMLGVSKGFRCDLAVVFTHFPMTFAVEGNKFLLKNFLGEKGARITKIYGNVKVKTEKTKITITGMNKEDVGQTASNIEHLCKIGKRDRRTFQDGLFIVASGVDDDAFVNEFDAKK